MNRKTNVFRRLAAAAGLSSARAAAATGAFLATTSLITSVLVILAPMPGAGGIAA